MAECIFCKILGGDMKADVIHEDGDCIAFRDINPQAPTHVLVIPRRHIRTLNDLQPDDEPLVGRLYSAARLIAHREGIAEKGYRTVMNCNPGAGQTVYHIHLHVLGGRQLRWPPG